MTVGERIAIYAVVLIATGGWCFNEVSKHENRRLAAEMCMYVEPNAYFDCSERVYDAHQYGLEHMWEETVPW